MLKLLYTKDNVKRFFNFRPLLWIFLTVCGAIYSTVKIYLGSYIPIIIFGIFVFAVLALFVCSLIKKDIFKEFFAKFGIKSLKFFAIMILCSAVLGSVLSVLTFHLFSDRKFENGNYYIIATAKEVTIKDNETSILLGSVEIDGEKQSFKILANLYDKEISVGDKLTFVGYLSKRSLVNNGSIQTSLLKTKTFYYCNINKNTLTIENGNASFTDIVKNKTKTILKENMTDENAGFAYAVLVGDKSILSDEYYSTFKNAGLAHVLAVSGLHVGFLVALIEIVLKLCKVKGKYRFFITLGILIIYNIMCNFSPSVFRASVMSICLLLGLVLGERNDILSNLSLAGIIVAISIPLNIFDVGFLLSFGSVFGIVFFAKPISKLLRKIKFPKFLAESIAVTVSATIGTIPFVFKYFGEFAPISLLSNLIVLPLFSLMFSVLILCVFLNLIVNLPFLISFSQFFVNILTNFSAIFAKFGLIKTLNFDTISIFIYYFVCFVISPYFMISARSKLIGALGFVVCMCGTICLSSTQKIVKSNYLYTNQNSIPTVIYTTDKNKSILVNFDKKTKPYAIKNLLKELKLESIDYFVIFNYSDENQDNIAEIVNNYNIKNIFVFGEYQSSTKIGLISAIYKTTNLQFTTNSQFEVDNFSFERFESENLTKAIKIKIDNKNVLQILKSITQQELNENPNIFFNIDYEFCIVEKMTDTYLSISTNRYISKNATIESESENIEILNSYNLWTFNFNCAKI